MAGLIVGAAFLAAMKVLEWRDAQRSARELLARQLAALPAAKPNRYETSFGAPGDVS